MLKKMSHNFKYMFLQNVQDMSNVTLVCMDGESRSTHALLLASVSDFLKCLLLEVPWPAGDQVVILLPDTSLQEVEECLEVVMGKEGGRRTNYLMDRLGINMLDQPIQMLGQKGETDFKLEGNLSPEICQPLQYLIDEKGVKETLKQEESIVQHGNKDQLSNFGCNICGDSFSTKTRYGKHMRTEHSTVATINCDICSNSYVGMSAFNSHKKSHTQGNMCDLCGKELSTQSCLEKHRLKVHGTEDEKNSAKKYKCKSCPSRFYSNNRLTEHELIHSDAKTFQCDRCDFMSKTPHALTIHVNRKHLGKWKITKEQQILKKEKQKQIRQNMKIQNGGRYRAGKERDHFNKYMKNFQQRERTSCKLCQKETTSLDWHNKVYHLDQ